MVWGYIGAPGKGNLDFCDGSINAETCTEVLEFKTASFPEESMYFSQRQWAYYKGMAEEEIKGSRSACLPF